MIDPFCLSVGQHDEITTRDVSEVAPRKALVAWIGPVAGRALIDLHCGQDVLGTLDMVSVNSFLGLAELKRAQVPPGKPGARVGAGNLLLEPKGVALE